jgi:hypothetical protein
MASSIDALDLPIQFFALGTAMGMLAALIRYHRTGELDHWPVYVAYPALALFFAWPSTHAADSDTLMP